MLWTWQLPDWPRYQWDRTALRPLENRFLHASGRRVGALLHTPEDEQVELRIEWLTAEAVETSAIEGEILNRDSVRSSLRRHFGLTADRRTVSPAAAGVAEMMVALYEGFDRPLSHETIREWHRVLMRHRPDLTLIGDYRRHPEPMQVVSGPVGRRRVHYEAPPSLRVPAEMDGFVNWYRESGRSDAALSPLTRAGLAHLYFVHIHPFEDGNGRIARAIAQKTLAESFGEPSVIALSRTIARRRRAYYDRLAFAGRSLDATDWGLWFAETTLDAQLWGERRLVRSIEQRQMFDRLRDQLNPRQEKALRRLFRAEPDGFRGGLSAGNYQRITGAAASSATRDLADLVGKGALRRTGSRRHTRYWLDLPPFPAPSETAS